MKNIIYLIFATCLFLTACTPAAVQIAEEVIHEASVAENAIEQDIECPGCACSIPEAASTPHQ
jgi:hypothetical protein